MYKNTDNPYNIFWPLSVKVRNLEVTEVKDRNGNPVSWLIPFSVEQMFDATKRYLNRNAPFIDNAYANRGYITNLHLVNENNQIGN